MKKVLKKLKNYTLKANCIGIDLGSSNTLFCVDGKIVLNEPTLAAVKDGKVVKIGRICKDMEGRVSEGVKIVDPIEEGEMRDGDVLKIMISEFLKMVCSNKVMLPKTLISVSPNISQHNKEALIKILKQAGAGDIRTIEEPLAAAKGANMKRCLNESFGEIMVNIGGGTADIAVISKGCIIESRVVKSAGKEMDEAIRTYIKREKKLLISRRMAEELKIKLGYASPRHDGSRQGKKLQVKGATFTGPYSVEVTGEEIHGVIKPIINRIMTMVKRVIENVSPEISGDFATDGHLVLSGGVALLPGLKELAEEEFGMKVDVADEPLLSVIKGINAYLMEQRFRRFPLTSFF